MWQCSSFGFGYQLSHFIYQVFSNCMFTSFIQANLGAIGVIKKN
jgi:hypothetical protein